MSPDALVPASLPGRARRAAELTRNLLASGDLTQLDAIVDGVKSDLDVSGSHLSMLTDRQITAAASGVMFAATTRGSQTPFDDTICANALRVPEPLAIPDTRADSRVSSIPAVAGGHVGAYLGTQLRIDDVVVGVLCVFSSEPRSWTDTDLATLESHARTVETELLAFDQQAAPAPEFRS